MWNERYGEPGYAYGEKPNDFLVEGARAQKPGKVLCLAEGEGRNAVYLALQGHEVTAVDSSSVGLENAQRFAAEKGVAIQSVTADLADYEIPAASFDTIVSIWCHVPEPLRVALHQRVAKGLRPGGAFILEAYTPRQLEHGTGGPPVAELMMTLDGLREELAGLTLEVGREVEREVQEGKYHRGLSHVVQVLARKG